MKEVWFHQRRAILEMGQQEGITYPKQPRLGDALRFGELLTLASSEEKVRSLMREDRAGAGAFLDVVRDLEDAIETAEQKPSTSEMNGPFHELADFAVEFLNGLKELAPERFE